MQIYKELLNTIKENEVYTEKDLWLGNTKEGYKCATDGVFVLKKSEAINHSAKTRNKDVLFMGKDTAYVHKIELDGLTIYGYLKCVTPVEMKWYRTKDDTTSMPSVYTIKEPICFLETGEIIFNGQSDYMKEQNQYTNIHQPDTFFNIRGVAWEQVGRPTTKTTTNKSASEELQGIFNSLHPTDAEYADLMITPKGMYSPRTLVNAIGANRKIVRSYHGANCKETITRPELKPIDTNRSGVFVDFDDEGLIFRVYNKGYEVARVDLNENFYTPYNKDTWVYNLSGDRLKELLDEVFIARPEEFRKSKYSYAIVDFTKTMQEVIAEFRLNKETPYEQLMKTEYAPVIERVLQNQERTKTQDNLARLFGLEKFNNEGKTLYQKLNLNKYQFKKIMDTYRDGKVDEIGMSAMRYFMNESGIDFISLNNEQFDILFDFCNNHLDWINACSWYYRSDYREWLASGSADFFKIMGMFNRLRHDLLKNYDSELIVDHLPLPYLIYRSCYAYYKDFFSLRKNLLAVEFIRKKDAPVDVYAQFSNDPKGFKTMHDKLTDWMNLQKKLKLEETTPEWEAQYTQWKKLEYSSKKYGLCVVAPVNPGKLVEEGKALRHCVAGYIERVTKGTTSVVFIRNIEDKNKPFYTVEVRDGLIKQIHGNCNCNPTRPVIEFAKQWAKAKDLRLGNYKQLLG